MPKALAALALATTIVAQAPAPPQPPTFRARADLVQVDVVVVDGKGDPVRGLTAADFTLLDRKKPQAIVNFDEVSHARPAVAAAGTSAPPAVAQDVSSNQTVQAGRLIVMVIDDLHIYKERTARARDIASRVLTDLGHQSSMAVLFTSGEHSTQVMQDRARLAAAVETLKGRQSWRRPNPAIDRQRGGRIDPETTVDPLGVINETQKVKVQAFFDNMAQYKTLQDAARMLGGGDTRRKAFVLISEGIGKDLSGLFGAMAPPGSAPQGGAEYATSGNLPVTMAETPYHELALIDMMEALRRGNVATYAIDPRGKVDSKDLLSECFPPPPGVLNDPCSEGLTAWHSPLRQAQHGLEIVSQASGGFAVTNTDDFTSGLKRIVDDLDHYYLLGFYPADVKGSGYRPLDVRIPAHPDWKLRFRHGYMPGGPKEAKPANELVALSAGVLPNPGLPLRLSAIPLPGSGQTARVVITLEVTAPRRQLEEGDRRLRDTLQYEVLIVDEKKAKVRSVRGLSGRLTLSPSEAGTAPDAAIYQVSETIDVLPGRYEFRVSATSAKLSSGGSVYLGVDVPDFRSGSVALGGLSVGYAEGARVAVAPASPPPAQRGARVITPAPDPRPSLPFPPSLDREFTPADTLRVYVEGSSRAAGAPTASIDVVAADGKIVRSPSPSFTTGDPIKIQSVIPLAGLAPGAYVLRATLSNGAARAIRESGFVIR